MGFKERLSRYSPAAAAVIIIGSFIYAVTAISLNQSGRFVFDPSPTPSSVPSAKPSASPGPSPIWSDEFDGPAGQAPSPAKWNHDTGASGWGNDEWQYYTDSTQNAALDGRGRLVITALRPERPAGPCSYGPCDITSARLNSEGIFSTTYGRIEARIQTPAGRGLWPAFWMVANDDQGEIDIMENYGRDPRVVTSSLHIYGFTPLSGITEEFTLPRTATAAGAFHIYTVDWTPEQISWSVDGRVYHTVSKSNSTARPWVFDRPYYLLLNLAVGAPAAGYPDASTPFPARLVVDYVRVYK